MAVLDRGFVWRSRYGHQTFLTWGTFVSTELLNQSYRQWCADNRVFYPEHRDTLGKFMQKFYCPHRPRGAFPIYEADSVDRDAPDPVVVMDRPRGFLVRDVDSARREFAAALGLPDGALPWDQAEVDEEDEQFAGEP
jgi:hypothetical protein